MKGKIKAHGSEEFQSVLIPRAPSLIYGRPEFVQIFVERPTNGCVCMYVRMRKGERKGTAKEAREKERERRTREKANRRRKKQYEIILLGVIHSFLFKSLFSSFWYNLVFPAQITRIYLTCLGVPLSRSSRTLRSSSKKTLL